jgi:NAD(P)-dependent dehydrogenase (short-subunit alcohol dehydrogenase family)
MLLEGEIAVITGAASERGLGQGIAKLFSEHGATVAILDLDENTAKERAESLGSGHGGYRCDVTNRKEVISAISSVVRDLGTPTVLVNNAGITQPKKMMEITDANYDAVLDVSLRGTFICSQEVIPLMRKAGKGSIISISSVSAKRGGGIFGGPHYSAAKAGIMGLTRAMARELAPDGIRVNALAPGLIDTDITQGKLTPKLKAEIVEGIPMKRIGKPSDVAGACLFFASELSSNVTGEIMDVNGGMHID